MQVQPFQGWVENSYLPRASLRTAALSPRLFTFVPFGDGATTSRKGGRQFLRRWHRSTFSCLGVPRSGMDGSS